MTVDLPSAIPPVLVDREQLQQVFFNLAKNAMEAMKDGGKLSAGVKADDESVESYILDSGEGMDREWSFASIHCARRKFRSSFCLKRIDTMALLREKDR